MLIKNSRASVESTDGFTVTLDRGRIKYTENNRHLTVITEHGLDEISVYSKSIKKWHPPYNCETIDDNKRASILTNIQVALDFLGVKYIIE